MAVPGGSDTEQPEPSWGFRALARESSALRFQLHLTPEFQPVGFSNYFTKTETLPRSISPGQTTAGALPLHIRAAARRWSTAPTAHRHRAPTRAPSSSPCSSQADPKPPSTQGQLLAVTCQQTKKELLLMLLLTTTWCRWALCWLQARAALLQPEDAYSLLGKCRSSRGRALGHEACMSDGSTSKDGQMF